MIPYLSVALINPVFIECAGSSSRQKDFVKIAVIYFVHRVFFSLQEKAYAGG